MENRKKTVVSRLHSAAGQKKNKTPSNPEKPRFAKRKKLFGKKSFRRQYYIFREGGLGVWDSFFNALYITLSEASVEKEKKKMEREGEQGIQESHFLELHTPLLKLFSAFPRRLRSFGSVFYSLFRRRDHSGVHRSKIEFLKAHLTHCIIVAVSLFIIIYISLTLRVPVVLHAQINGKTIGVVESESVVDSAVNQLEDQVEIILGESFRFPYEISYTFARQRESTLTEKNKITEALYTYISDLICTAGGLYVDEVLVAVCQDAQTIQEQLDHFIEERTGGEDTGILNEICIITQAYPRESMISAQELHDLLDQMSLPFAERKNPADSGESNNSHQNDSSGPAGNETVPAMALLADTQYVKKEAPRSRSNRPQSIDSIKLDVYTTRIKNYEEAVPYRTVYQASAQHYTSMADVTRRGVNGISQVQAKVYYVDGKEARREIITETVLRAPIDQVISIGTKILPEEIGYTSVTSYPKRFILPHIGILFSSYGNREDGFHGGWDFPGEEGDNIYAAASGKVVVAIGQNGSFTDDPNALYTGYGYCVVIEHENGYRTLYAHCSRINVTLGQEVKQGEKIAEIGNTGVSEGNHVHFEIRRGGNRLDPALYIYDGNKTIYD